MSDCYIQTGLVLLTGLLGAGFVVWVLERNYHLGITIIFSVFFLGLGLCIYGILHGE